MFYSATTGGFYDLKIHKIPSDAVEITQSAYTSLLDDQAQGKVIACDGKGYPISIDQPSESVAVLLERVKAQLRIQRMPMLDALAGIAGRAQRAGDAALAAEADALAIALLDITDDPVLNSAEDYEAMLAAGKAAYKQISATASADLSKVFKEITGA